MLQHTFEEQKQKQKFEELRRKEEEESTRRSAEKMGMIYTDLANQQINANALSLIDQQTAKRSHLIITHKTEQHLKIAVKNPKDPQTMLVIENLKNKGFIIDLFLVSKQSLKKAWEFYKILPQKKENVSGVIEITPENLQKLQKEIKFVDDFKDIYLRAALRNATAVLELIIAGSLSLESSDIHIEPHEDRVIIRFRIDGILQEVATLDKKMYTLFINRIKLLSEMKLNIKNMPQDGRFSIVTANTSIEIRTSILPSPNGESVVMRILNPKTIAITMEELGILEHDLKILKKELERPNGLILVTGPTGSGKTTTLYACIKKINTSKIKIITIEDPVEYHIEGISQSQIAPDAGYTFASGLKSILRQDPNVLLIGEVRDAETADIALHAALTGHLVFSTLHTNDAPSSIIRLIDMKINPAIIAPAINILIAQRLVRKICSHCSSKSKITDEEFKEIIKVFADMPSRVQLPQIDHDTQFPRAKGCKTCNNTGYKGRIGLFEMFRVGPETKEMIVSSPTQTQLRKQARKNGMVSVLQDGFLKVVAGITTIEEVKSVTE